MFYCGFFAKKYVLVIDFEFKKYYNNATKGKGKIREI